MLQRALIVLCVVAPASLAIAQSGTTNGWQYERLARLGDLGPNNEIWEGMAVPSIRDGAVVWWGNEEPGGIGDQSVYRYENGVIQTIASGTGLGVVGTSSIGTIDFLRRSPHIGSDGSVLFHSTEGVFVWSDGTTTQLADRPAIEGAIGEQTSQWGDPIYLAGEVVFPAGQRRVTRTEHQSHFSLVSTSPGGLIEIENDQSTIPGLSATALEYVPAFETGELHTEPRLVSDGTRLLLKAADALTGEQGIYFRNPDGLFDVVADQSTPINSGSTTTFESFSGHVAITGDTAAFVARQAGGPEGIYTSTNGIIEKVVDTSMVIRDFNGDTLDSIGAIAMAKDIVLFQGCWDCTDSGDIDLTWTGGLFTVIDGNLQTILERGDVLDGGVVESVHITAESFDGIHVVAKIYFSPGDGIDFSYGIYKIAIPSPASYLLLTVAGILTLRRKRA